MMHKRIVWVLMLLLLVATILAAPPQASVVSEAPELTIIYPKNDFFLADQNFTLHFHVFNSTGYMVNNETTECFIHIYNETGNHIVEADLLGDSNGIDFYNKPDPVLFSHIGEYGYIVQCNNSQEAGFVSTSFLVARGSPTNSIGGNPLAAIIIAPLLFAILLMLGAITFDPEHHAALKIALFLFSFTTYFMSMLLGFRTLVRYYDFASLQGGITTLLWVIGIMFFAIMSYFLIYVFVMSIHKAAQKKDERLRY